MRTNKPISEDALRLGTVVRGMRERRRLSQGALGEITNLGQSEVSRIESGQRYPSIPQLDALAAALATTPHRLLLAARKAG